MHFDFRGVLEGNVGFLKTFFNHAEVMGDFEVSFKVGVLVIESEFLGRSAEVARKMVFVHMLGEELLIVVISVAELKFS